MAKLISYDLRQPGRDYAPLHEVIKALGVWWHCLESIWIVDTALSPAQVRDRLTPHIDANDLLVVVELTGSWASYGLSKECNDWLSSHVSK